MLKAKNIQIIDYPIGDKIAELLELSVQQGMRRQQNGAGPSL